MFVGFANWMGFVPGSLDMCVVNAQWFNRLIILIYVCVCYQGRRNSWWEMSHVKWTVPYLECLLLQHDHLLVHPTKLLWKVSHCSPSWAVILGWSWISCSLHGVRQYTILINLSSLTWLIPLPMFTSYEPYIMTVVNSKLKWIKVSERWEMWHGDDCGLVLQERGE